MKVCMIIFSHHIPLTCPFIRNVTYHYNLDLTQQSLLIGNLCNIFFIPLHWLGFGMRRYEDGILALTVNFFSLCDKFRFLVCCIKPERHGSDRVGLPYSACVRDTRAQPSEGMLMKNQPHDSHRGRKRPQPENCGQLLQRLVGGVEVFRLVAWSFFRFE